VARRQTEPGWMPEEVESYLRRFHYRLGPDDLEGMERFRMLLDRHGLLDIG
jgi:predicted solute-binding protein